MTSSFVTFCLTWARHCGGCGDGKTTYEYDSENRLIRVTDHELRLTTYTYDGLGRRIEKNVDGIITRYVYDREDILFEYEGDNELVARYTHGPGIDDPIAMERGGEAYFYHTDGLGSITHITDTSKQIVTSYTYDGFGNITSQTGNLTNPYTYTGREYGPETGLYYYRARYYDPKIGRFLQPDPLDMAMVILIRQYYRDNPIAGLLYQYSLSNPLGLSNVYPYVVNNPINWVDPAGTLGPAIGILPVIGIISGAWVIGSYVGEFIIWYPLYSEVSRERARTEKLMKETTDAEKLGYITEYYAWLGIVESAIYYNLTRGVLVTYYNLIFSVARAAEVEVCE